MARTVKEHEYARKRNDILDATQKLLFVKGYDKMTIQDIIAELKISSGAFYHYFDSKWAVLEAFIQRIQEVTEKPLLPIVRDPHMPALEKLQGFFDTLDQLRIASKSDVIELGRVWYTDSNAMVRQRVEEAVIRQRAPLVTEIVRQGVDENAFTTAYPDHAGEVIMSLLQGMGNAHAKLLLSSGQECDEQSVIGDIVTVHAVYMDAIERVLGAPPDSLYRVSAEAARAWVTASKDGSEQGRGHD